LESILQRQIPGFPDEDAIGCYPLFSCQNWLELHKDMNALQNEIISLSLVADPFGNYDLSYLQDHFHVITPFKKHYVLNMNKPLRQSVSKHHQYYGNRALRSMQVELCPEPIRFLDEWLELYGNLTKKYKLDKLRAGTRNCFLKQLQVPGILMFRASEAGETIGLQLWYIQNGVAYNHLSATAARGYQVRASYALYWTALNWLVGKVQWIDLGGVPGTGDWGAEGLRIFKKGWANGTRPVYFCGRIFNIKRYSEIARSVKVAPTKYFPAYRLGEFGS
jgi:hypothetical protein